MLQKIPLATPRQYDVRRGAYDRRRELDRPSLPLKTRLAMRVVFVPCAIFTILGFALFALWVVFRDDIKKQSVYLVQCENVRVWNPPPWVPRAFVNEVFEYLPEELAAKPLNSLDAKLVPALVDAFRAHPLVEDVQRVAVRYPALVDVNLVFREPVALVNLTPEARNSCRATLRRLSPEDADVMAQNDPNVANLTSADEGGNAANEGAEPEIDAADARFIVDQFGYRLPNAYFVDHPDSYRRLPEVVGISTRPTSEDGRAPDPLVEDAAEFARFLRDAKLTPELSIVKIFILQKQGETSPRFFFQAQSGRVVKWGRFERPETRREDEPYAKRSAKEEWNAIVVKQNEKIRELVAQIEENAREVEVAAARETPGAREKAEALRKVFYDVSVPRAAVRAGAPNVEPDAGEAGDDAQNDAKE